MPIWGKQFIDYLRGNWKTEVKPTPVPPTPVPPTPVPPTPVPPTPVPPTPEPEVPDPEPVTDSLITDLLNIHNSERGKRSLEKLTLNDKLTIAARKHADWMCANQKMSHTGKNGKNHADRISDEGYPSNGSGENIAMGYPNPKQVMIGWMDSPGHRANILGRTWKEVGLSYTKDAKGYMWWCAVFASPRGQTSIQDYLIMEPEGIQTRIIPEETFGE